MSRFLYLMRHAQSADKQPGQADKERELTLKGVQDARLIGGHLYARKKNPKIILSSTAVRAKTTAQLVSEELHIETGKIQLDDGLYDTSVRSFLELVKEIDNSANAVMCIGHNPAISYLAKYLTNAEIGDMPPAALVIIQFQQIQWSDVSQGKGILINFVTPENLVHDQ